VGFLGGKTTVLAKLRKRKGTLTMPFSPGVPIGVEIVEAMPPRPALVKVLPKGPLLLPLLLLPWSRLTVWRARMKMS
jgi:hypothetical protein